MDNISLDWVCPSWSQIEQEPNKLAKAKVIKIKEGRLLIVCPEKFYLLKTDYSVNKFSNYTQLSPIQLPELNSADFQDFLRKVLKLA